MPASCCAYGCTNRFKTGGNIHFFGFQFKDEEKVKQWVHALKRKGFSPTKASKLCSEHFLPTDFLDRPGSYIKKLKPDAVPSVFSAFPTYYQSSENWPTEIWRNITLCSRHFMEEDYRPGYQGTLRALLKTEAVPTQKQPAGPGVYGILFPPMLPESPYSDSCGMDHDYIATTIPKEIKIQGFAELNEENVSCHPVLEDVRKELCRLCGQKGSPLIPIFETLSTDTTQEIALSLKIDMYLPFKMNVDDPLPSQICSNCYNIVNQWHELYICCVAANAVLWKAFGTESEKSTRNNPDARITRVKEEVLQKKTISTETNARDQEEPLVTVTEAKEQDVNCSECGKNKMLSSSVEKELFDKEFEKTFANIRSISYKCLFCYDLFKSRFDRKNHMVICRQLSTICELCGHEVPRRKDLRKHIYLNHTRKNINQRYLCNTCDKCFKTAAGLSYHIECVHEKSLIPQYHCELCCCAFVGEQNYRLHQKKHEKGLIKTVFQMEAFLQGGNSEDSQTDVYSCPVCQETFNDMLSLIIHLTTKKKVKCSVCLKVLSCEKHFMVHVCGQWTCQYCLKRFDQRVKWIVHERLHTGEKPIKCRTCDLTFRSYNIRRRHEAHHDPAYQCSYCGKSFKSKCVFRDHILCHEGKVFSCHTCGKKFSGKMNLRKHNNRFHKNFTIPS